MRFVRAGFLVVLSLSALSCKKTVTVEPPEAAPPPVEDAAPPPAADLDAGAEAAAPLATATATATATSTTTKTTSGAFTGGDIWNGSYNCRGQSNLALHISSATGNRIVGVFEFTSPKGVAGSFHTSGILDPVSRHLVLTAGSWIKEPPGFVTVNLDGIVDPAGHHYTGRAIGPGCTTFSVRH